MLYITFFIKTSLIAAFVTTNNHRKAVLLTTRDISIDENDDITIKLNQLFEQLKLDIDLMKKKVTYRLVVIDNNITWHNMTLPNIGLKSDDLDTYVRHSLAKMGNDKVPFVYDFFVTSINDNNLSLLVCTYPLSLFKRYVALFEYMRLDFIGIIDNQIEDAINRESMLLSFEQIAGQRILNGINFLPWRMHQKKCKRKHFLLIIMSCSLLFCILTYYLFWHTKQNYDYQLSINTKLDQDIAQSTRQLSLLADLHQQLLEYQTRFNQQKTAKQQLIMMINHFNLMALVLPDGLWFNSLSYRNHEVELNGEGLFYHYILDFLGQLNQHTHVRQTKLLEVKKYHDLFRFDIYIKFDDDNKKIELNDEY